MALLSGSGTSREQLSYLHQKPELDAKQVRSEMEASGRVFGLEGGDHYQEMVGDEISRSIPFQTRLQELRGEEYAMELDISSDRPTACGPKC